MKLRHFLRLGLLSLVVPVQKLFGQENKNKSRFTENTITLIVKDESTGEILSEIAFLKKYLENMGSGMSLLVLAKVFDKAYLDICKKKQIIPEYRDFEIGLSERKWKLKSNG